MVKFEASFYLLSQIVSGFVFVFYTLSYFLFVSLEAR